jgi:hypothetical protein
MLISECCGALQYLENTDVCSECLEHADFYDDEEDAEEEIEIPV